LPHERAVWSGFRDVLCAPEPLLDEGVVTFSEHPWLSEVRTEVALSRPDYPWRAGELSHLLSEEVYYPTLYERRKGGRACCRRAQAGTRRSAFSGLRAWPESSRAESIWTQNRTRNVRHSRPSAVYDYAYGRMNIQQQTYPFRHRTGNLSGHHNVPSGATRTAVLIGTMRHGRATCVRRNSAR
jgi:hypothetical protein